MSGGQLTLVSIGPGDLAMLTEQARRALYEAEALVGYQLYIDMVRPLLRPGQHVIASPIGDELERARQAVALAAEGRRVALISSGDIGIYAMAGPVFDTLRAQGWDGAHPAVVVVPGISAVQAAAARLGAPISHDFCTISLSDLLTPWEQIERRVRAAAWADFVVAFYNPRSRARDWQLGRALELLRAERPPGTPVALVRNVSRPDEAITLTTLAEVDPAAVDMFTLVLVGNSQSYTVGGRMATPRGYVL
ncbi:MAG TPA: precorrin-3B C(17)-methyltransferase [Roseiflexaceae bacterium]|nr:precorrin-3B C(17)-methyltransferase [Roseiflexaceae bacterium]